MDKQVKHLARQLRQEGIAPERNLWPGIEQAIDDAESHRSSSRMGAWFRMAAVAATLILLVGSGYFGGSAPKNSQTNHASLTTLTEDASQKGLSLLENLNNTISDLDEAMALDPDNIKLTRLSLMTHKSRANLLRAGARR